MLRIPQSPPVIQPLADTPDRPLFSVMVPAYNCSQYLVETLESVLMQDPGAHIMQIEVVDDCSTDTNLEQLVREVGKGRVQYFRQPKNVGNLRNFETCINRAKGRLVHLLHGDDRVRPGFYQKIKYLLETNPEAGAAFTNYSFIDSEGTTMKVENPEGPEGLLQNWLLRIAEVQRVQFVSIVVKREVYERLGAFYGMTYGEDWEMWVRIARYYPVAYSPEVLSEYRTHPNSLTWRNVVAGQNIAYLKQAINLILAHVPPAERAGIEQKAKRRYARFNIALAKNLWNKTHDVSLVNKQIQASLQLNRRPLILSHVLHLYWRMFLYQLRRPKNILGQTPPTL